MNQSNRRCTYSRGFTLIELLVVISIIALLSSIVFASVASARVRAQNSARMQSVNQVNNAISLYITDKGHAPLLSDQCGQAGFNEFSNPKCIAVQTSSNVDQVDAWNSLKNDLAPYMKSLPVDPCGIDCDDMGYYYVSPAGVYNNCYANASICDKESVTESSYQVYAKLQGVDTPFGYSTNGTTFNIPRKIYGSH